MEKIGNAFLDMACIMLVRGDEELAKAAEENSENEFILDDSLFGPDRPLQFLFLSETLGIPNDDSEHYLVIDDNGLIRASATVTVEDDQLTLDQICVRDEYKKQGYGRALLETVMRRALNDKTMLAIKTFTENGRDFLAPLIRKIHTDIPDLEIYFELGENRVVTGHIPYKIVRASYSGVTLELPT